MTNDYQKGAEYREATDANFRTRRKYAARIRAARKRLITDNPEAKCQSRAETPHKGPLELNHVDGDLSGESGYSVLCRKHNRAAAGQAPGKMTKPHNNPAAPAHGWPRWGWLDG